MLNSAGTDAQFVRSRCAISRGILTYLSIYTSDSAIGDVVFSYKLTYRIDGSTAFEALLKNGDTVSPMIPYSAAAKVSGCINPITGEIVSIVEETYIQCKKESIIRLIKDWHNDCVTHITDKMKLAEIVVTYEQLFGLPD